MVAALASVGVPISVEEVEAQAGGAPPGRPHVADALVAAGRVRSRRDAFRRWLGDGRVGDVPRRTPALDEGVSLLRRAGGLAVLAHPDRRLLPRLDELLRAGLDGLEVFHPSFDESHVKILQVVVQRAFK